MPLNYEYDKENGVLKINCLGSLYGPSLEDYEEMMSSVIDSILEVKKVSSIVLSKEREYEYGPEQSRMLVEIAEVIEEVIREKLISTLGPPDCRKLFPEWAQKLQSIVVDLLRRDPIGAYVEVLREIRRAQVSAKANPPAAKCYRHYIDHILLRLKTKLAKTELIQKAEIISPLAGHHIGDRSIYRQLFNPSVRPNFMLTRFMITPPENGKSMDKYKIGTTEVEIFKIPGETQYLYHVTPPEFKLSEEHYSVLDAVRRYMAAHRPKSIEFVRSEERKFIYNIGEDMVKNMAARMKAKLSTSDLQNLATILTRYTAGLGVMEVLLSDEKLQDIYVNSPVERLPILVFHSDYEECRTNLIPTKEDAEGWATRLRSYSGRPLDEANPVLDTELTVPGGRARFAVITRTLSPDGLAFAVRRHRDKPWTLPLFVKSGMMDSTAAGLLSFLFDNSVSMLVAGGRSSGKTSLLAALMLELLPKTRVIVQEDSVTGDTDIVYQNDGEFKTGKIGDLIDKMIGEYGRENEFGRDILDFNPKNIKVFSLDKQGKVFLAPVSKFIRHKVNKRLFEVETATGRKIKVTEDHSLFTLDSKGEISPIKSKELNVGNYITTPRFLPLAEKSTECLNLLKHLDTLDSLYIVGDIKEFLKDKQEKIRSVGKAEGYGRSMIGWWIRKGIIPAKVFRKLDEEISEHKSVFLKSRGPSKKIPVFLSLDKNFLTFIGLWLADGCYDRHSVILSVGSEEEKAVVHDIADRFGLKPRLHHDKFSTILGSSVLKKIMIESLGIKGNAYTKRIPHWIFRLSRKQISYVLKGLFSGDGCASEKEISIGLSSEQMLRDIQTLLLGYDIIFRINSLRERDKTRHGNISSIKALKQFKEHIGFLQAYKNEKLAKLCSKVSTHDSTDIIPLSPEIKEKMTKLCKGFNSNDYLKRSNNIGREKLKRLIETIPDSEKAFKDKLHTLVSSDVFWDRITNINSYRKEEWVYDFSVPGYENFICNNIVAHNTLELPIKQLRDLNFNIESLKSRSVITKVETEVSADEALRTALRLGDSALIVGEIRSMEAKVLWEAMRIGALSNVVAGTIHGESAYGVYDRVVNDLGVQPTSFKATDIVCIARRLRSADGMHTLRRMVNITEVRKEWDKDPMKEGAFVELMTYSGKEDRLKATNTLSSGESEILNRIASYVRDWSGNWSGVWENINARAKIKQMMVDAAEKAKRPELIEAEWVVKSNSAFHVLSESVKKETGLLDSKRVYKEWAEWFKKEAKL